MAYTSDLYPQSGFLVLFAIISPTIPIAGRMSTYTSGCARNQKRCCHKRGDPEPYASTGLPAYTSPEGKKKLVPTSRSINCNIAADSSGGNAKISRNEVTNCAQIKNGNLIFLQAYTRLSKLLKIAIF